MEFVEIKNLESVYNDMQQQFPPEELKSCKHLQCLLGKNYKLYQGLENTNEIGYFFLFEDKDFILLDYLAIYQKFHSKGYGSKILQSLKKLYPNKKGCFLEVEKPDNSNINTFRRIKFYEKQGAVKLDLNYLYPSIDKPLPMDLYYIPYRDKIPNKIETERFITELFNFVHTDITNKDDIIKEIFH